MLVRLNKYLASLGVASRRRIDELITQSRVIVNQKIATLGQKIDPQKDIILLDSKSIKTINQKFEYLILNKPVGVLTTTSDDRGRQTVLDLVKSNTRLFPVGRLDYNSSGLVLLTNDGTMTNFITHPKYHLPKTYLVTTNSHITKAHISKLKSGLIINNHQLVKADTSIIKTSNNTTILKITLYQGLKRQIRLMFSNLHLNLKSLHRTSIGPISLGNLKAGQYRPLTKQEILKLKSSLSTP